MSAELKTALTGYWMFEGVGEFGGEGGESEEDAGGECGGDEVVAVEGDGGEVAGSEAAEGVGIEAAVAAGPD